MSNGMINLPLLPCPLCGQQGAERLLEEVLDSPEIHYRDAIRAYFAERKEQPAPVAPYFEKVTP